MFLYDILAMLKTKIIALLAINVVFLSHAYGTPAYPRKQKVIVCGDTLTIQLKGDEHCKYAIDEEGYTILSVGDEWRYAKVNDNGIVVPSSYIMAPPHKRSDSVKNFLSTVKKGIMPKRRIKNSNLYYHRAPAVGLKKILVILMQFPNMTFSKNKSDFYSLFNEKGYHEDGAVGSVHDFYQWASYGQLDLQCDILGPYTTLNNMAYYGRNTGQGGNDSNPFALFQEAINEAAKDVNYSDYDGDGDGYVDNIHIIYAGYGEEAGASSNAIWAHEMSFDPITVQGMKINKYSCAPELRGNMGKGISRIGPHCHEIGHALGAMDYYDTNYETEGNYPGTGEWDVMASGSWNNDGITPADFNPYVKIHDFGWSDYSSLCINEKNIIEPSSIRDRIYKIDTNAKGDYFLLENRDGRNFHASEPGKGLLIFHVGPQIETRSRNNTINASYPQQCYLVCASSAYQKPSSSPETYGDVNSSGCPYPGTTNNDAFSDATTPAALTISGQETGISLIDIRRNGDDISLYYSNTLFSEPESLASSWGEDFENLLCLEKWSQQGITGNGEYKINIKLTQEDLLLSPTAASGKGYMKYESSSPDIMGRRRNQGRITSPFISLLPDKEYEISVSVRKVARYHDSNDFISLSLLVENYKEEPIISQTVINQTEWKLLSTSLPNNFRNFSLVINCDIDNNSVIFIDDLNITELSNSSNVQHRKYYPTNNPIYSLKGEWTNFSNSGIKIFRMKDGSAKKVVVK